MTRAPDGHLSEEEVFTAIEGQASEEVEAHLATCTGCHSLWRQFADLYGSLRTGEAPTLSDSLRERVMARYRKTYGAKPLFARVVAARIPLYQVAAALAVALALATLRPRTPSPTPLPPARFAVAESDLWGPSHPEAAQRAPWLVPRE